MNLVQGPRPFARTDCTGMDLGKGPLRLGRQDWRLCMVCKDYLPATDFPKGQRRYRCKKHGWLKGGKRSKLKMLADPRRFAVNRLWGITFSDRTIFRQEKIAISQREIKEMTDATLGPLLEDWSGAQQPLQDWRLVPIRPRDIVSRANAALVPKDTRRLLIKAWKQCGEDEYGLVLSHFWSPENNEMGSKQTLNPELKLSQNQTPKPTQMLSESIVTDVQVPSTLTESIDHEPLSCSVPESVDVPSEDVIMTESPEPGPSV